MCIFPNGIGIFFKRNQRRRQNEEIINSIIQEKKLQGILVADIAYMMIFSIIVMLTSCRFFHRGRCFYDF